MSQSATTDTGYDPAFLSAPAAEVPLPTHPSAPLVPLPSTHFTVVMNTDRRLAQFTAVNIDGSALLDLERGDDWHLDPRLPADEQAGPELYARNDLDRGHLVRRRDPVWGDRATAQRANEQTFAYTNAAPQASVFNQSQELWAGLEDYVLGAARTTDSRLNVITGPVFADTDEVYRGIRIPKRFFKIAAWADAGDDSVADGAGNTDAAPAPAPTLAATGYVLDQSPLLRDAETVLAVREPELGPFRTFQVPIADIAEATGLDLGPLVAADHYVRPGLQAPAWQELTSTDDIVL